MTGLAGGVKVARGFTNVLRGFAGGAAAATVREGGEEEEGGVDGEKEGEFVSSE